MAVIFASSDNVDDYEEIAREFVNTIFELDYDECFISDESTLSDFAGCCVPESLQEEPKTLAEFYAIGKAEMVRLVRNAYGIEVEPRNYLVEVFEQIRLARLVTIQ
jgi:hypothetical protein